MPHKKTVGIIEVKPWLWFQRIIERASISAAARDLDITVAALSQALKREERLLGVRLLQRTTRQVTLTPEGEIWYRATLTAQAALDEGLEQLHQNPGELMGSLRIAAPSDFGRTRLMSWLNDFIALYPRITPILHIHDDADDLIADSIDLAIRYGEPKEAGMIVHALYPHNRRVIAASPEYWRQHGKPEHPTALAQHACLAFNIRGRPHLRWTFTHDNDKFEMSISPSKLSNDGAIVGDWSRQGQGVMYRSRLDLENDLEAGRLETALDDWLGEPCPMYLMRPGNRLWPARVQAFWNFCKQHACIT